MKKRMPIENDVRDAVELTVDDYRSLMRRLRAERPSDDSQPIVITIEKITIKI